MCLSVVPGDVGVSGWGRTLLLAPSFHPFMALALVVVVDILNNEQTGLIANVR